MTHKIEDVREAIWHLRQARDYLASAECPKATAKVRSALKSAEGALRNAWSWCEVTERLQAAKANAD